MDDSCWRDLLRGEYQGTLVRFKTDLSYKEMVLWARENLKPRRFAADDATVIRIEEENHKTYSKYRINYMFRDDDTIAHVSLGFGMYFVWFANHDEAMIFKLVQ